MLGLFGTESLALRGFSVNWRREVVEPWAFACPRRLEESRWVRALNTGDLSKEVPLRPPT